MTLTQRVTAPVVRPVLVGWLDFESDPAYGWTGPGVFAPVGTGDPVLDSNIFTGVEGAIEVSDFGESTDNGAAVTLTFSIGDDNNADIARQIVRDRRNWQLRAAKVWQFFLMDDEASVFPEFVQLFSGVMVAAQMVAQQGEGAVISIECDQDIGLAVSAPSRYLDHQRYYASDTWSSFILALAKGPIAGVAAPPPYVYTLPNGQKITYPYGGYGLWGWGY